MSNFNKPTNKTQSETFISVTEIINQELNTLDTQETNPNPLNQKLSNKRSAAQIIADRLAQIAKEKEQQEQNQIEKVECEILEEETPLIQKYFVELNKSKGVIMHYKCDVTSLEFPLFAFKPSQEDRQFKYQDIFITLKSTSSGLATMSDKDLWIYAITKLIELHNEGKRIARTIHFVAYDYLKTIKGDTGGKTYKEFLQSLERLAGTRVLTNIETGGIREKRNFGLIESYKIIEEADKEVMAAVEITLPDWLFRSVEKNQIKTLSEDYFKIRKPIYKRLYELGLKHCGEQVSFKISVEKLFEKSGSVGDIRNFRRDLRELTEENSLPDYHFRYDEDEKMVYYISRDVKDFMKFLLKQAKKKGK